MTELQDKGYILWFDWLGNKLLDWSQNKPANKDLRNCVKAASEIGMYVNMLQKENIVLQKRISMIRADKNNAVERARRAEEELEQLKSNI